MSHPQPNPQAVLIDIAESAIRSWAGPVDRTEALRVLRKWRFYPGLSNADRTAVLARFPEPTPPNAKGDEYAWGDVHVFPETLPHRFVEMPASSIGSCLHCSRPQGHKCHKWSDGALR